MRLLHKLRCIYDEPYRIRLGFGLSPIRSEREMKALMKFCASWLEEDYTPLNRAKSDVLCETLSLYHSDSPELLRYIEDHVGYYWS